MPRVLIVEGPLKGRAFEVGPGSTVGRNEGCTVRIEGRHVSRVHCTFEKRGEQLAIVDNESRNGIFVNGHKVKEHPLAKDDEVEVGEHVFVFEPSFDASAAPPPRPTTARAAGWQAVVQPGDAGSPPTDAKPAPGSVEDEPATLSPYSPRPAAVTTVLESMADPFADARPIADADLRATLDRQEGLLQTLRAIQSIDDERQASKLLLDRLVADVKAQRGFVMLSDDRGKLVPAVKHAPAGDDEFHLSNVLFHQVSKERKSILAIDRARRGGAAGKLIGLLVAPLVSKGSFVGFLCLEAPAQDGPPPRPSFTSADLRLVSLGAGLASPLIPQVRRTSKLNRALDGARRRLEEQHRIIGDSPAMLQAVGHLEAAAPTDATVLILGERGTGKEQAARAIHARSGRSSGPFVAVNCAALSSSLIESEFFGHEKGAFTGANESKIGLFEAAHAGTLFLDEVGSLPPESQARLLKVLEGQRIMKIGGKEEILVDVRVIAAAPPSLEKEMQEGRFRQELYWKLAVVAIKLPPLRERREDVPKLFRRFLETIGGRITGSLEDHVTPEVIKAVIEQDWPGNVRELRIAVEQMLMGAGPGRITMDHAPAWMRKQ